MRQQHFSGEIQSDGSQTFIPLPFDPNEAWGPKDRHDVTGTVNGKVIRGPLKQQAERYVLAIGPAWRRDNHLEAGSLVEVILAPEGPHSGDLAQDLVLALDAEPQARRFFDALPTFYRKNYVRWVESAKRSETRAARVQEMVALLKDGKREK